MLGVLAFSKNPVKQKKRRHLPPYHRFISIYAKLNIQRSFYVAGKLKSFYQYILHTANKATRMNGVKYSKRGGIIANTLNLNSDGMKMLRIIWAGPAQSDKKIIKVNNKLAQCFTGEKWEAIAMKREMIPFEELATKVAPRDFERFDLPEGETAVCVLILRTDGLKQETQDKLEAFAAGLATTMGFSFRVVLWN